MMYKSNIIFLYCMVYLSVQQETILYGKYRPTQKKRQKGIATFFVDDVVDKKDVHEHDEHPEDQSCCHQDESSTDDSSQDYHEDEDQDIEQGHDGGCSCCNHDEETQDGQTEE